MSLSNRSARAFCAGSELLEDRVFLAAHSVATESQPTADLHRLNSSDGNQIVGMREQFGLDGLGQTVAIIDSGVAFDHPALGGGYGTDFRVVGGFDFAEPNDPAPYDDGPSGLHGTHVAGIIGSSDADQPGLAPGVDFVALRIFDDQGVSEIEWLEDALQWVHTHKDSFESPITTVNLSVGFDNSVSEERLSQIEDELRTLYDDGIFVAVAAGNQFSPSSPLRLSYPASSKSVVPVASVDSNNQISRFSQRNSTVLAAPGENINSTAPDHIDDFNGKADDFYSATGTSMAAPYVAGASVLVREAMQRAGYTTINQDTIYTHLRETADKSTDPVTGLKIATVNIERAVGAILKSLSTGPSLPSTTQSTNQGFSNLRDLGVIDFQSLNLSAGESNLRFTASQTGIVTVVAETSSTTVRIFNADTNQLLADSGHGRVDLSTQRGERLVVQIESRGSSAVRIANVVSETGDSMVIRGTSGPDDIRVGRDSLRINEIDYKIGHHVSSLQIDGSSGRDELIVDTTGDANVGTRGIEVTEAGRTISTGSFEKIAVSRSASQSGGIAAFTGTGGDDIVGVSSERLALRSGRFQYTAEGFANYTVDGNGGRRDRIRFAGTEGSDRVVGSEVEVEFSTSKVHAIAVGFDQVTVDGGSGHDVAELVGTSDTDFVYATPDHVRFASGGKGFYLGGFDVVSVDGAGGLDSARLVGSDSNDSFGYEFDAFDFTGSGFKIGGNAFESIAVYGKAGSDRSTIAGTPDADEFRLTPSSSRLESDGVYVVANQFEFNTVETTRQGIDTVFMDDSSGDDVFLANDQFARLSGDGFHYIARGFANVYATSHNGGDDRASLFDSAGDDSLFSSPDAAILSGLGFHNEINGFERIMVRASRGMDQVHVSDDRPCRVEGTSNRLKITGDNSETSMSGFDEVNVRLDAQADVDVDNVDYVFTKLST